MQDVVARVDGPLAIGSDTPAQIEWTGGGQAANSAAWFAAAEPSLEVVLVGRVGDDPAGRAAAAGLRALGVDARLAVDESLSRAAIRPAPARPAAPGLRPVRRRAAAPRTARWHGRRCRSAALQCADLALAIRAPIRWHLRLHLPRGARAAPPPPGVRIRRGSRQTCPTARAWRGRAPAAGYRRAASWR
jgi:hypothetical protein